MKQGLNFPMPITVYTDMSIVEKIEFKFKQRDVERIFIYPSEEAYLDAETGDVILVWMKEDTYLFHPKKDIELDARVTLLGSIFNPETENVHFTMESTLFKENE